MPPPRLARIVGTALICFLSAWAAAEPVNLLCEHRDNPLGIDQIAPRFSWQNSSAERSWRQRAYRVLVATSREKLAAGRADVWDSGVRESDESADVAYAGPALISQQRYFWSVTVWDEHGKASAAAAVAWWEMGFLRPTDWAGAKWISWQNRDDDADRAGIRWIGAPPHEDAGQKNPRIVLRNRSRFAGRCATRRSTSP